MSKPSVEEVTSTINAAIGGDREAAARLKEKIVSDPEGVVDGLNNAMGRVPHFLEVGEFINTVGGIKYRAVKYGTTFHTIMDTGLKVGDTLQHRDTEYLVLDVYRTIGLSYKIHVEPMRPLQ